MVLTAFSRVPVPRNGARDRDHLSSSASQLGPVPRRLHRESRRGGAPHHHVGGHGVSIPYSRHVPSLLRLGISSAFILSFLFLCSYSLLCPHVLSSSLVTDFLLSWFQGGVSQLLPAIPAQYAWQALDVSRRITPRFPFHFHLALSPFLFFLVPCPLSCPLSLPPSDSQ